MSREERRRRPVCIHPHLVWLNHTLSVNKRMKVSGLEKQQDRKKYLSLSDHVAANGARPFLIKKTTNSHVCIQGVP